MSPGGRRPGKLDTRDDIIQAAKRVFAAHGYDKASLRAIAREAGVDAALVHHYFDGKADLFVAAMALPFDPRQVHQEAEGGLAPDAYIGDRVVEGFLTMWDWAEGTGSSFVSCVGAMAASPQVADAMREFVSERVWRNIRPVAGEDEAASQVRRSLVAAQLMGLAYARYVLRVPPLSTSTPAEIAVWAGPAVDRYVRGPLD
jgi:AcrR family transcriptional regulator